MDKAYKENILEQLKLVKDIDGWLSFNDTMILNVLNQLQNERGVSGDIFEIGVYQGKATSIFTGFLSEGEKIFVCDVFEDSNLRPENLVENQRSYSDLSYESFVENVLSVRNVMPEILRIDSLQLENFIPKNVFRLIHIDGSHNYTWVRSDLRFSRDHLISGGIVVVDDFRSAHTPGVSYAAWESITLGDFVPLVVSANKMYMCAVSDFKHYYSALKSLFTDLGVIFEIDELQHSSVLRIPFNDKLDAYHVNRLQVDFLPKVLKRYFKAYLVILTKWSKQK